MKLHALIRDSVFGNVCHGILNTTDVYILRKRFGTRKKTTGFSSWGKPFLFYLRQLEMLCLKY